MNAHAARLGHPRRETLTPRVVTSPPITETGIPDELARCTDLLPGTDLRCLEPQHADTVACHATGVRDGVRYAAFWWRVR